MALDDQGAVIATVFRNPPRLVLLDANSGVATINLETCGDADDVFFDSRHHRIYVSCGEGSVDVLEQGSTGYYRLSLIKQLPVLEPRCSCRNWIVFSSPLLQDSSVLVRMPPS
jgi:hypothetical protein